MAPNQSTGILGKFFLDALVGDYKEEKYFTLKSKYPAGTRGALHATTPGHRAPNGKKLSPSVNLSFVPLLVKIGAVANDKITEQTMRWVQSVTYLLSRLDEGDQGELVDRFQHIPSSLVSPRTVLPGLFYAFKYQAEAQQFDRYPMVLVLSRDTTGFLGLNFHYLPLRYRFWLFEAMMPLIAPLPPLQLTRLRATYDRLASNPKYEQRNFSATVKRYSFKRIQSRAVFISPVEWPAALAYPNETFVGTTKGKTWQNSLSN